MSLVSVNHPAIEISAEERSSGQLSPDNLQLVGVLLRCRGFVVLPQVLPRDLVEHLQTAFADLFEDCVGSRHNGTGKMRTGLRTGSVFWERASRFRIFPRLSGPFGNRALVANAFGMPLLRDVLGDDLYCKFVSSDTCVKGAILQSPHRDIEYQKGAGPNGYLVNVPLCHCSTHNGPLEVWPSSQLWAGDALLRSGMSPYVQDARNEAVEKVAEYFPSQFVELWPGDLLLRDPGVWHRGTPNESDSPRTMLTIAYFRRDYSYSYGDAKYNVDDSILATLDPAVRDLLSEGARPPAVCQSHREG